MNKKIKRFATTTIVCVLVASIFGTVMVLAPPPEFIFPQLIDVFVTNTSDDPIPVDVTDETLDVTLDEPIEVTNPLDESLNVTVPDGVEIINTEPIEMEVTNNVDVSGWLHTTQHGSTGWQEYPPPFSPEVLLFIETKGYRKIDIVLSHSDAASFCNCSINWYLGEGMFLMEFYQVEKWLPVGNWNSPVHLTYDVMGTHLVITMESGGGGTGEVNAKYYLTT